MGSILKILCIISTFITYTLSSDEVPVALWNIKGNSLHVKDASALGSNDGIFTENLRDILSDGSNILVFAISKLSLEDFSSNDVAVSSNNTLKKLESFLDSHPFTFLPSVKEPLSQIHNVHCGVEEIIVDQAVDENVLKSVAHAFDRSCVVILHINDFGIKDFKTEGNKNIFLPSFDKTSKNIIGIFTSMKSSWEKSAEDHHMFRRILAAPEDNFINITGCLIAYTKSVNVNIGYKEIDNSTLERDSTSGSSCGGNSSSAILQLKFKGSGNITEATIRFNFTRSRGAWTTETTIVEMSGNRAPKTPIDIYADTTFGAAVGFSFSCGHLELSNRNRSNFVTMTFDTFQVQPFDVKEKFSESFDCVPYFTIPIWMGVFVSLIFIAIINCGVYALFSVHTMDRFDDPKGKTISVTAAVD